ncbi:MAG: carbon starvation protein A [Myxococcota bacterium]|jgi:carbon starvation protein|nr:carbon starvation protein A [Myxococcota bacterium]
MLTLILVGSALALAIAYKLYGGFLVKQFGIDNANPTPSHTDYDGVDRVPAKPAVLLGHHFSSIAGAGPIVGPIIAAVAFGWAPTLAWVLLGSIFIGGVHDFGSLVASIRHKARSIADVAKDNMSMLAYRLLLVFIWLTLVYVLTVFIDLTSMTFVKDGGVATSSLLFVFLAIGFGLFIYRLKVSVLVGSLVFVPLVFLSTWLGQLAPFSATDVWAPIASDPAKTWDLVLVFYAFIASTTPVWILLQPRDYLSSFLLYASVLAGIVGIALGGFGASYPAFTSWDVPSTGALVPILFITVACGACSGFHSVVASGTSSKQLDKESDARTVGYGAMLLEALVAVIAISTVVMLPPDSALSHAPPLEVYGKGMGRFFESFGLKATYGESFGLLALSTFILTTLDTATRLGRYIFEELFALDFKGSRYVSTAVTLLLPAVFVLMTLKGPTGQPTPAWKVIWPVFGATNQLLAGLALLTVAVWMRRTGKRWLLAGVPAVFMLVMTLWALVILILQSGLTLVGVIAIVLLALAVLMIAEALRSTLKTKNTASIGA